MLLIASPIVAQQPVIKQKTAQRAATPVVTRTTPVAPTVFPAIDTVQRAGASPGPAAEEFLMNGEAVRVRGRNLGTASDGSTVGIRREGKILTLKINPNVARTATEIATYMPGWDGLERAGLMPAYGYDVVLVDRGGRVLAAKKVTLRFRNGQNSDMDGDGSKMPLSAVISVWPAR